MTKKRYPNNHSTTSYLLTFFFVLFGILCILFSDVIKESIIGGIKLSVVGIIPSIFPFFVISDYLYNSNIFEKDGVLAKLYGNAFGLPPCTFIAFLLGNLCGFPIGVKCAAELYSQRKISSDECERLILLSNNPSLAFTLSAVGLGMFGSIKVGILLYLTVILSSSLLGLFARNKRFKIQDTAFITEQSFDFSASVKNAGIGAITVSSFIIFFSGICGLLRHILKNDVAFLLSAILLEVGGGIASVVGSSLELSLKFILTAFALGFSGLSVFFQALSFTPEKISKKKLLLFKFIQGLISSLFVFLFLLINRFIEIEL